MKGQRYSYADVAAMAQAVRDGRVEEEAAARGIRPTSLRTLVLRRTGVQQCPRVVVSDERFREALAEAGSYRGAGRLLGLSKDAVKDRALRLGIEPGAEAKSDAKAAAGRKGGAATAASLAERHKDVLPGLEDARRRGLWMRDAAAEVGVTPAVARFVWSHFHGPWRTEAEKEQQRQESRKRARGKVRAANVPEVPTEAPPAAVAPAAVPLPVVEASQAPVAAAQPAPTRAPEIADAKALARLAKARAMLAKRDVSLSEVASASRLPLREVIRLKAERREERRASA